MKLIPFTNDTTHFAQVDDVDFETLSMIKWRLSFEKMDKLMCEYYKNARITAAKTLKNSHLLYWLLWRLRFSRRALGNKP